MKTLSAFLTESTGKKVQEFEHHHKGKYTLHKKGDVNHLKNKYGEVSHTFVGMEPDEISYRLKHNNEIHGSGKTTVKEEYLEESSAAAINTHRGGFNEAMFAYHLNNTSWIDDDHKKAAHHHKEVLDNHDPLEARRQNDRAAAQAKSFLEHAKANGYSGIKKVHLTAKPGDIEKHTGIPATQQENPSDVVAHFSNKPKSAKHGYVGASLKSSSSKKIGFHNGGLGSVGRDLGVDLETHANKLQNQFLKKHGHKNLAAGAAAVAGEKGTSSYRNSKKYDEAMAHATKVNGSVRDKLHEHYQSMKHEDLKSHLLRTFVKANSEHALPYVKTHGTGGYDKEATAHTEDPSDNEMYHSIRDSKKLEIHKSGGTLMSVHADGKRMFGIQVKHNNGPLTSMKILGQP